MLVYHLSDSITNEIIVSKIWQKDEYTAFLSLKSKNNIIIQKADKGNIVVILDRVSYVSEMENLLADTSKFIKVAFNSKHKVNKEVRHLTDIESSIKHCLDDLLKNNYLSKEDYNYMRPCGSKPGVLYGLCKVHKKPWSFLIQLSKIFRTDT